MATNHGPSCFTCGSKMEARLRAKEHRLRCGPLSAQICRFWGVLARPARMTSLAFLISLRRSCSLVLFLSANNRSTCGNGWLNGLKKNNFSPSAPQCHVQVSCVMAFITAEAQYSVDNTPEVMLRQIFHFACLLPEHRIALARRGLLSVSLFANMWKLRTVS